MLIRCWAALTASAARAAAKFIAGSTMEQLVLLGVAWDSRVRLSHQGRFLRSAPETLRGLATVAIRDPAEGGEGTHPPSAVRSHVRLQGEITALEDPLQGACRIVRPRFDRPGRDADDLRYLLRGAAVQVELYDDRPLSRRGCGPRLHPAGPPPRHPWPGPWWDPPPGG